jgi:hypothetical protein
MIAISPMATSRTESGAMGARASANDLEAQRALDLRRAGARRTALIVGGIACAIYIGFILRGVLLA